MTQAPLIDLDAARREVQFPDGIPVVFKGEEFTLPAELPAEVLVPLLSPEIDLPGLVAKVLDDQTSDAGFADALISVLTRPGLSQVLVDAIRQVGVALFGDEGELARFVALRPSLNDYARLGQALLPLYGTSLGDLFASLSSSGTGGATQKQTSSASTRSTSATRSARATTRG